MKRSLLWASRFHTRHISSSQISAWGEIQVAGFSVSWEWEREVVEPIGTTVQCRALWLTPVVSAPTPNIHDALTLSFEPLRHLTWKMAHTPIVAPLVAYSGQLLLFSWLHLPTHLLQIDWKLLFTENPSLYCRFYLVRSITKSCWFFPETAPKLNCLHLCYHCLVLASVLFWYELLNLLLRCSP